MSRKMDDNYIKQWFKEKFTKDHPYLSVGIDMNTGEVTITHVSQKKKFKIEFKEVEY
jgi:hypothetical protein